MTRDGQARKIGLLRTALWKFDYNPDNEDRGFFCAGCDLDGDARNDEHDERHDDDCATARKALRATDDEG